MIRPFSNGTQYADWLASNCDRCKKQNSGDCFIQTSLACAYVGDGEVPEDIAKKMGRTEETKNTYVWPCSEVELTEEWKKEYTTIEKNRTNLIERAISLIKNGYVVDIEEDQYNKTYVITINMDGME
jgi:hypothetical protein